MNPYTYTLNGINRRALDAQLSAALGPAYGGFADQTTPEGVVVTVNVSGTATQADIDQLNSLMAGHDPAVLTPDQQAAQQRQQKLASLRQEKGADLDPADYGGEQAAVQALAQKLAWLEQEVLDLRGGRL